LEQPNKVSKLNLGTSYFCLKAACPLTSPFSPFKPLISKELSTISILPDLSTTNQTPVPPKPNRKPSILNKETAEFQADEI
jgi:hypothetical protein